jgi:hypothetical protein
MSYPRKDALAKQGRAKKGIFTPGKNKYFLKLKEKLRLQ